MTIISLLADIYPLNQGITGVGPLGQPSLNPATQLADVLSKVTGFLTVLSFLWFTFQTIIAAIQWIGSSGEKAGLQAAQQRITHSLIGLLISVAGIFLVYLISSLLGISDVLNLEKMLKLLTPK